MEAVDLDMGSLAQPAESQIGQKALVGSWTTPCVEIRVKGYYMLQLYAAV